MDNPTKVQTAWMWATDNGGVNGAKIDTERKIVQWFDEIGCACDDSTDVQTYAQFRENGAMFTDAPEDVIEELSASVAVLDKA